jgi:outer membrane usher protein
MMAATSQTASATEGDERPTYLPDWETRQESADAVLNPAPERDINPSDRVIQFIVPVQDGKFHLGDVVIAIQPNDTVSARAERLAKAVGRIVKPEVAQQIEQAANEDGFVALAALRRRGIDIRFHPGEVALHINPTVDQRIGGTLSGSASRQPIISGNLQEPALVSGYVNVRSGVDYISDSRSDETGFGDVRLDLESAVNVAGFVLENEVTFEEDGGVNRRGTRLVYDLPDHAVRTTVGDVAPYGVGFQSFTDVLGVSVEKSYGKLQPYKNIRPTGQQSFRLTRPSTVQIMNNGRMIRRVRLAPGNYDINDIPLSGAANDIQLIIEDDLGERRVLDFTVFFDQTLLAPGVSEWALTSGFEADFDSDGEDLDADLDASDINYDFDRPLVTGYYTRGLTQSITGQAHFQADTETVMSGIGGFFATAVGFMSLEAAASAYEGDTFGAAVDFKYDMLDFDWFDGIERSFRFAAEYRTEKFATIADDDPFNDYMVNLSAAYSQDLFFDVRGTFSINYAMARDDDEGDRFGVQFSASKAITRDLSASLSVSYDETSDLDSGDTDILNDGINVGVGLTYRIDSASSLDASYDTLDGRARASYSRQEGTGVGSWSTYLEGEHVGAEGDIETDETTLNGSLNYVANRAELGVSHYGAVEGINGAADADLTDQRTTLRAASSIVFADGQFAIGRPVSNSFAIVSGHETLSDSNVIIAQPGEPPRAYADALGPAVVSGLSSYTVNRVAYDADNLPVGYDLGTGAFELLPPYKSGYALQVGSEYTISAYGRLLDGDGEPVALLTGVAYEADNPDGRKVEVFTNRAGRFGAQGMRPGLWIIEMATTPKTRYEVRIPEGTVGLYRAGKLSPATIVAKR